jgi:hypothetical protein
VHYLASPMIEDRLKDEGKGSILLEWGNERLARESSSFGGPPILVTTALYSAHVIAWRI